MHWLSLFFLLASWKVSLAQELQFKVKPIDTEEGLLSNFNTDLLSDQHGFLWISSNYGLTQYNGSSTVHFQMKDGLQSNEIYRLYDDSDSILWIQHLFSQKIDLLNPSTNHIQTFEDYFGATVPFSAQQIAYIFRGQDKSIYIKTRAGDYYHYLGHKKWQHLWSSTSDLSVSVHYVNQNKQGLWVQEKDSCYWINKKGYTLDSYYVGDSIQVLGEYQEDLILYQIQALGIQFYKLSPQNSSLQVLKQPITLSAIQNINILLNHNERSIHFWNTKYNILCFSAFTESHLFQLSEIPSFLPFQEQLSLPPYFKSFAHLKNTHHQQQIINMGEPIAIIHLSYNHFQTYPKSKTTANHSTRGIVVAPSGDLYVQSYSKGYACWRKPANSSTITPLPLLQESAGLSSLLSKDGKTIIMGTENAQIVSYNPITQESKTYYSCEGVLPVFVMWAFWAVHEEENGQIWIGSRDGIHLLDSSKNCIVPFEHYNDYLQLSKSIIWEFYENEKGIWVASNSGLYLIDKTKGVVAHYHSKAEAPFYLPSDNISFIYEDQQHNFWLASQGDGLLHLDNSTGKYQQWTTEEGLSNNRIHSIYADAYNNLWMSSDYGLMSMNLANQKVTTFLPDDGLPHEEFNRKSHYQDQEGYLYFGGLRGITKFHPKYFHQASQQANNAPFKLINCSKWDNKKNQQIDITQQVLTSHQVELYPNDIFLTLEYALMDFKDPKNHQYSYKIEGYTNDWIITSNNTIRLSNLPPGEYTLTIRARGKSSVWQENALHILIKSYTVFYKTTWFLVLCLCLIVGSLVFYYYWRINQLNKKKELLEQAVKKRTLQIKKDKETIEQQAQHLKELDTSKNNFFVNISHELRTPLTLISTPLQQLLEQAILKNNLDKHAFQTLQIAYQNSQKLQTLVNEILLLSKLETHEIKVTPSSIALLPFLQQTYASFESKAISQGNLYELEVSKELDTIILIDWKKLEHILYNLLSNAFKFASGQSIVLRASLEKEQQLLIEVEDAGHGIPAEDLPHIFDRYYQAKNSLALEQGGTGIGLALSYEFAQLLGGSLSVVSTFQEGSCFQLRLPLVLGDATQAQTLFYFQEAILPENSSYSLPSSLSNQSSTLLIVEDHPQIGAFLHQLLSKDFQVISCQNGQEAWDILQEQGEQIDLIISDLMMPKMDGYQLSKRIKNSSKWSAIPLIILSAKTTTKDKLTALRIGVDDYVIKPFHAQELLVRIQNLLHRYHHRKAALQQLALSNQVAPEEQTLQEEQIWLKQVEQLALEKIQKEAGQLNVVSFAEELGLSDRQLRRKLKQLLGMSPNHYLRELKLVLAKKYLEEQQFTSISKVAASVGFNTTSHFIKLYTERFGKSPLEYFL